MSSTDPSTMSCPKTISSLRSRCGMRSPTRSSSPSVKVLATKRTRYRARGQFLLSVFAVVWLNLAVQPCLMAMELAPEADSVSGDAAHSDDTTQSSGHDCDHCPPAVGHHAQACASGVAADCSPVPDYNADGRKGPSKLKDIPTYVAITDQVISYERITLSALPQRPECGTLNPAPRWPAN